MLTRGAHPLDLAVPDDGLHGRIGGVREQLLQRYEERCIRSVIFHLGSVALQHGGLRKWSVRRIWGFLGEVHYILLVIEGFL